jgi:hypothetical protein
MSEEGSSVVVKDNKVENWLNDREQMSNVPMSPTTFKSSSTGIEKLADSFREDLGL